MAPKSATFKIFINIRRYPLSSIGSVGIGIVLRLSGLSSESTTSIAGTWTHMASGMAVSGGLAQIGHIPQAQIP